MQCPLCLSIQLRKNNTEERGNIDGAIIYSHLAWMGRIHFLVGCYQDVHPCQRAKGKKIDLILYYLSCFSGSKLTLYLATENLNPSSFGAELLSAKNSPEGRKNSEFLNF